jgi:integrase
VVPAKGLHHASGLPIISEPVTVISTITPLFLGKTFQTLLGCYGSRPEAAAFEFLILTATRSSEVRKAVWAEFDLDGAVWLIPKERMMKSRRAHRVPLSTRCLQILLEARAMNPHNQLVSFKPRLTAWVPTQVLNNCMKLVFERFQSRAAYLHL